MHVINFHCSNYIISNLCFVGLKKVFVASAAYHKEMIVTIILSVVRNNHGTIWDKRDSSFHFLVYAHVTTIIIHLFVFCIVRNNSSFIYVVEPVWSKIFELTHKNSIYWHWIHHNWNIIDPFNLNSLKFGLGFNFHWISIIQNLFGNIFKFNGNECSFWCVYHKIFWY